MRKILIAAVIVAVGVFSAIGLYVHSPHHSAQLPKRSVVADKRPRLVDVLDTFGAWRVACRNKNKADIPAPLKNAASEAQSASAASGARPNATRTVHALCHVVTILHNRESPRDVVVMSVQVTDGNKGFLFLVRYPPRNKNTGEVDIMLSETEVKLQTVLCGKSGCVAVGSLTGKAVETVGSTRKVELDIPAAPGKAPLKIEVPAAGLTPALGALRKLMSS